ncbi:glutamate racemase [Flavobacterium sp.]|uniref:glutamate racemase n=1 Tax=Flavobacterium sp. TaxID=239 RepID=UPI002611C976|nr:glutamate racemase [Flavobacterium sp.]
MSSKNPIGLFDSGVGGISIWKEVHQLLPHENTIYLADSKNAPYGQKTKEDIIRLSCKNVDYLIERGCKMVIVACNTATTNAIKELRARYDIPFIGIEPAIKPAANQTQTETIGILATKGTLNSELFHKTIANYQHLNIIEQVGYNLVQLIENGDLESEEIKELLKTYLDPMVAANMDYLVLGCTHYPFLIPQIKEIIPDHIKIIDSGEAVAKQTKNILEQNGFLNISHEETQHLFYTNSKADVLKKLLGPPFSDNVSIIDF